MKTVERLYSQMEKLLDTLLDDPDTSPELILKTVHALARPLSVQRRYVWQ